MTSKTTSIFPFWSAINYLLVVNRYIADRGTKSLSGKPCRRRRSVGAQRRCARTSIRFHLLAITYKILGVNIWSPSLLCGTFWIT